MDYRPFLAFTYISTVEMKQKTIMLIPPKIEQMPRSHYKEFSFENWDGLWATIEPATIQIEHDSPPFRIDNVVSTFKMSTKLDLLSIAKKIFFLEYNCSKFTAATLRLKDPKTTALSFSSGSVVCTGAKSVSESYRAATIYIKVFQIAVPKVKLKDFKVQNIVASTKCPFTIDLIGIVRSFSVRTSFAIELFPGLVFRFDKPKIVFLVFRSGSVVITGANNIETIEHMLQKFYNTVLYPFRDTTELANISSSAEYKIIIKKRKRF